MERKKKKLEARRLHRPTPYLKLLHQFLKDFSGDPGIFPSRPFPKMVKIQNGKQLSHMGHDEFS